MESERRKVEADVLDVYRQVNPSEFEIEDPGRFERQRRLLEEHFIHHLKMPLRLFKGARVLDLGAGTGETSVFFALWGATVTCVEFNAEAASRLEQLFHRFGVADRLKLHCASIFDGVASGEAFDVTISNGVLHHTHDAGLGFRIQVEPLAAEGLSVPGVSTSAGLFQRSLQRYMLYVLSENDETEIVRLAGKLFRGHLDRAIRYGGRSERAVIYDCFVNPKWQGLPVRAILDWFIEHDLRLYSAWPPIVTMPLGDSRFPPTARIEEMDAVTAVSELYWMLHGEDDAEWLQQVLRGFTGLADSLASLTSQLADVTPSSAQSAEASTIVDCATELARTATHALQRKSHHRLLERLQIFSAELATVLQLVQSRDVSALEHALQRCEVLFQGTCGLGMNYFVGYRGTSQA